ncbi:hypothetical protein EIP86_006351 [Pleurotus ostreatoroseus]|nr:hypothetical protein EIP86_006351 [Pleurotus ostreatoroseus]
MGVAGLWPVLKPAGVKRSLTNLAVVDGFEANTNSMRGLRVGIDASIWMVHATNWVTSATDGRDKGENPELRTILFKCTRLMQKPFLPLFVFDGPYRPDVKRGKNITKTPHWMVAGTQEILTALGVEWRMAPGEAEAELAYLNRIGVIDLVLTDDVDTFLFGAKMLMRNCNNTLSANRSAPVLNSAGRDDGNHTMTYHADDILEKTGLTHGGLILVALLSGGDYHDGVRGCGPEVGVALARCGFGDTLLVATRRGSAYLDTFLPPWREEMRAELRTNARGFLKTKKPTLAGRFPDTFPDRGVLEMYVHPLTSETKGKDAARVESRLDWEKEMRVDALAHVCEKFFEWGYREAIIKRFRTIVWPYAMLRILRRAVLLKDRGTRREPLAAMVRRYFSTAHTSSTTHSIPNGDEADDEPMLVKIHMQRRHPETDDLLEYRLEFAPALLVLIAHAGIEDTRAPPDMTGLSDWSDSDMDGDDEDVAGKGKSRAGTKKPPPNPDSSLRLWFPASMVREAAPELVDQFEARQAAKGAKKAKAKTRGRKVGEEEEEEDERGRSASPRKAKAKTTRKKAAPVPEEEESTDSELPIPTQTKSKVKAKAAPAPFPLSSVDPAPNSSSQETEKGSGKPSGTVDGVFKARKIIRGSSAAAASSSKVAEVAKLFAPATDMDVFHDLTTRIPSSSQPLPTRRYSPPRMQKSRTPSPSKILSALDMQGSSRTLSQTSAASYSTATTTAQTGRTFSSTTFSSQPSRQPSASPSKARLKPKPFPMTVGMDLDAGIEVEVDIWRTPVDVDRPTALGKGKGQERAASLRPMVEASSTARARSNLSTKLSSSRRNPDNDVLRTISSPPRLPTSTKKKTRMKELACVDVISISSDSDEDLPPHTAVRKHLPRPTPSRSPRKRPPVKVDPKEIIEISD